MEQTLARPELLKILLPGGEVAIGGSQEWYPDPWQRMSGCGPTAGSNLIWYMTRSRPEWSPLSGVGDGDKERYVHLMQEMFQYITPGMGGVNTSAVFVDGIMRYGTSHGVALKPHVLEIPKPCWQRPNQDAVRAFVLAALHADAPVAFLNLSNGALENLESWHWVTLFALEPDTMTAHISDQGETLEIELAKWLKTSLLGGAMVYLTAG